MFDFINGMFEIISAGFLSLNVRQIIKDKKIEGVSWVPTGFFTLWGVWNLIYYPSLDQYWSFAGGICLVLVNAFWIYLVFYYKNLEKRGVADESMGDNR